MALTIADRAMQSDNLFVQGTVKLMVEENPILKFLPMNPIAGDAYKFRQEVDVGGAYWRAVNEDLPESTGRDVPRVEQLYLMGRDIFMDNFLLRTQRTGEGSIDQKRNQYEKAARAISREFSRSFFHGDDLVDPDEMPGLRRRLGSINGGDQIVTAGANGAVITTAMMDELIDTVIDGDTHIFMNATNRRNLTAAIQAGGASATYMVTYSEVSGFGKQVMSYGGVPIHVIRDRGTGATILDFNETCGASNVTASAYIVTFGDDAVFGIYNGDGPPVEVRGLGEDQDSPGEKGRIEFYPGLVVKQPRAAARLRGLKAA